MRGIAVPTMVWSRAASRRLSMTPTVESTSLRRGSWSALICDPPLHCAAHVLDESEAEVAQLRQLLLGEAFGETDLAVGGVAPDGVDAVSALLGQRGQDRPAVRPVRDAGDEARPPPG